MYACTCDHSIEAKTEEETTRIDLAEDEVKDLRSSITGVCYDKSGAGAVSIIKEPWYYISCVCYDRSGVDV